MFVRIQCVKDEVVFNQAEDESWRGGGREDLGVKKKFSKTFFFRNNECLILYSLIAWCSWFNNDSSKWRKDSKTKRDEEWERECVCVRERERERDVIEEESI